MKTFFLMSCLLVTGAALAEDSVDTWQNSVLTEDTIKKIQAAKVDYRKCAVSKVQKYMQQEDLDSRKATEAIIKECEPALAKMRQVYVSEKVPEVIADRHLKQVRIQTTRKALEELMFSQANRKAE